MKVSDACVQLVKTFEGLSTSAYVCPAGVVTIGYGHTRNVEKGQVITEKLATVLLMEDLASVAEEVARILGDTQVSQNEFDALCSFTFNLGSGNLLKSTLLKKLTAGDRKGAAQEFLKWNKAGGRSLAGLTRRREAEKRLFETPDVE